MLKEVLTVAKVAKKSSLFLGGVAFGTLGLKILASKEAKKGYSKALAKAYKLKDELDASVSVVKQHGDDVLQDAKYLYEQEKKEKEARKKQKVINVKELRFSPNIEDHDLNTKANRAIDFLKNGDRVKVSVRFRGREMGHTDLGRDVLDKFYDLISEYGVVDKKPKMEGRSLVMFLSERKDKDKSDN